MEVNFSKDAAVDAEIVSETVRETVVVSTPVEGVTVACENTSTPAAPVAPAAPAASKVVIDVAPAAEIPTKPASAPVTNAVVPATPGTVANASPVALDDDNIGFEDVILPRLNIVQKVGDLSNIYTPGEIVLNQQVVVHEPANEVKKTPGTGPLILTVLGFRKRQFTEKVIGGKLGLLLNDEAEIAKHNGTLDYKEWEESVKASKLPGSTVVPKRLFQRLATAVCLVQKPEALSDDDHVLFPYECEGKYYAIALWSMKGTAYTHGAKHMFTARKLGHLRTGYTAQQYGISTKWEAFGENGAFVPIPRPAAKNTEGFRAFCKEILGAGN